MPALELWTTALLLDLSIKAALLTLAAWIAMTFLRVRGPHLQHRVWLLVLIGTLLLPGLVYLAPSVSLPHWLYPKLQIAAIVPEPEPSTATEEPPIDLLEPTSAPAFETLPTASSPLVASDVTVSDATDILPIPSDTSNSLPASTPQTLQIPDSVTLGHDRDPSTNQANESSPLATAALTILVAYLFGLAIQSLRLLIGMAWTARLVRRSRPIQTPLASTWLPRHTNLSESSEVRVPVTIGYLRLTITLPIDWTTWSEDFLSMVLAHEAEHVRRRDTWTGLLAAVGCALYWFHPAAWFVRRRLTDLAEQICDDEVIRLTGCRADYAQNLLEMAGRLTPGSGRLAPVGVAMARKANVVKRIEAIIDRDRPLSRRIGTLAALLLLAFVVPLVFLAAGLRATDTTAASEADPIAEDDTDDVAGTNRIAGRVVDDKTDKPVSPFTAQLASYHPVLFAQPDGTFRFDRLLRRGAWHQLLIDADGYDRKVIPRAVAKEEDAEPLEVRLTPIDPSRLLTIAGRIVNETSQPVADAQLRLIVTSKPATRGERHPIKWSTIRSEEARLSDRVLDYRATTTDSQGRFRFDDVRDGRHIEIAYWGAGITAARMENLEDSSHEELANLTIHSQTSGNIRLQVDRNRFLNVKWITLEDVLASSLGNILPKHDAFEIHDAPPGSHVLLVYGLHQESKRTRSILKRIPIEVKPGQTTTIDYATVVVPDSPKLEEDAKPLPASATSADDSPITLTGQVTNPANQGIGNAQLRFVQMTGGQMKIAQATTDETGQFSFRVPSEWAEPEPAPSMWTVWCHAPGHQLTITSTPARLNRDDNPPIKLTLDPASDTSLVIEAPDGSPISGARVEPYHLSVAPLPAIASLIVPDEIRSLLAKESNPDGRVDLPEIASDRLTSVQVTAEGYGTQQMRLWASPDKPTVSTIRLRTTGRLEGRLISDERRVIADTQIYVSQSDFAGQKTSGTATAETDDEGRFVVPAIAAGRIKLGVHVDKSLPLRPRIPEGLKIEAGETTSVEIPFEKPVRVHGRVQTYRQGTPIAGAVLSLQTNGYQQHDQVQTNADGRFEANVVSGKMHLQLIMKPREYSSWVENPAWLNTFDVPAGADSFAFPILELAQAATRTGRLIDQTDRPVAGATVAALVRGAAHASGETDENGSFSLNLPPEFQVGEYGVILPPKGQRPAVTVKQKSPLILQVTTQQAVPDEASTPIPAPFAGRLPPKKQSLLQLNGGNAGTAEAVSTGLKWLARNQQKDGSWSLTGPYADGARRENREAATAMALLAFQGDGNTTGQGDYKENVQKAWDYLLEQQDNDGCFFRAGNFGHRFYTHGQATIAICELFAMTKDRDLRSSYKESAEKAIDYCVKTQSPRGGWRYTPQGLSDTSVTGWILTALHTARMAGLDVPDKTLGAITKYLDQIAQDGGSRYPYEKGRQATRAMTAEGLLCRQILGWQHGHPELNEGVNWLLLPENKLSYTDDRDVYYWYYATQLMYHMGGEPWQKWNRVMREELPLAQEQNGPEGGSWHPDKPSDDEWGAEGGRLFVTCLSLSMLEVYYRHSPLYPRTSASISFVR